MSNELAKLRDALRARIEEEEQRALPVPLSPWTGPFSSAFSFRTSYTEITAQGGTAHVRRRETRYENGRLVTQECEGEVDREAFESAVRQSQEMFASQMQQMMRLFFAPVGLGWRRDRDE